MPKLSVVMIVKNEAACLGDCLGSVQAIADELVVADTGSTDGTVAIAEEFGARVFSLPWNDDFAEARNRCLARARGDWLLHLDADEVLDPDGARRIREIVDADGYGADAIEVTLANYCDDIRAWRWVAVDPERPYATEYARGYAGYIAADLLRLFRGGGGFEYREPVHENITESVREKGGRVRHEPVVVHHYGYAPGDDTKKQRYLAIARKKTKQRPDDPKSWHDFAEQVLAFGRADEAEMACRKALELEPRHVAAATTLAGICLNAGRIGEARALFEDLEKRGFTPPHVVMTLGAIAYKEGRTEEASRRLEAVVAAVPRHVMANLYLARTYDLTGRAGDARAVLEELAGSAPGLGEPRDRLEAHRMRTEGEAAYDHGDLRSALESFLRALKLDPEDPLLHNNIGVVQCGLGRLGHARESFQRALRIAHGMDDARQNLAALGGGMGGNGGG